MTTTITPTSIPTEGWRGTDYAAEIAPVDKRVIQERNRVAILNWLMRFGWLTSRMIASLVWEDAAQPMSMARRTLKDLVSERFVISRPLAKGGAAYLLAAKGARLLQEQFGIQASSGNNLQLGNPVHRSCSNWYLIDATHRGLDIVTEHEIVTERGPFRVLNGKAPDGLVIDAALGHAMWMEVEHSQKSRNERQKIVALVQQNIGGSTYTELANGLFLSRVVIVSTNPEALRWMAASFEGACGRGELRFNQVAEVDACLLPISEGLVPGERVDGNLWWDFATPDLPANQ